MREGGRLGRFAPDIRARGGSSAVVDAYKHLQHEGKL